MSILSLFPSLYNIRKFHCRTFVIVCCCILSITVKAQSDSNVATPVQKIAFIDHSRVRSEYKALQQAKESLRKEWQALQHPQSNEATKDKKAWQDKHAKDLQQYEVKIMAVIREVAAKGGFTDVKPIPKDSPVQTGVDITDTVLQKLNTKN
jgi:Skp family chaperone for outer membrane proteins